MYIYRSGSLGPLLKKALWIDGECLGESAPNVFFHQEVKGDVEHKISTASEFSPNDLIVKTTADRLPVGRDAIPESMSIEDHGPEVR